MHPLSPGPPRPPGAQTSVHPLTVQGLDLVPPGLGLSLVRGSRSPRGARAAGEAQHPPPPPNHELPVLPGSPASLRWTQGMDASDFVASSSAAPCPLLPLLPAHLPHVCPFPRAQLGQSSPHRARPAARRASTRQQRVLTRPLRSRGVCSGREAKLSKSPGSLCAPGPSPLRALAT